VTAIHIFLHYSNNLRTKFITMSHAMFSLLLEWMQSATSFDTIASLQTTRTTAVVTLQAISMSDFIVSESGSMAILVFK